MDTQLKKLFGFITKFLHFFICYKSGSNDKTIKAWEILNTNEKNKHVTCLLNLNGHKGSVKCLKFISNNELGKKN